MRIFYYIEPWPYCHQHLFPTLNQHLYPAQMYGTNLKASDQSTPTRPMPLLMLYTFLRLTTLMMKHLWIICWNLIFLNHINMLLLHHRMPFQIHRSSQPRHQHLQNANRRPRRLPKHPWNAVEFTTNRDPVLRALWLLGLPMKNKNFVLWKLMRNLDFRGVWSRPRWANPKRTFVQCGTSSRTHLADYLRCANGKRLCRRNVSPTSNRYSVCLTIPRCDGSFSPAYHFTTVSHHFCTVDHLELLTFHYSHAVSYFIMSLRIHLDRYCHQRAMASDHISPTRRSRSPTRASSSAMGTSPFHRPPGWTPPSTTPHRPVILQLDLKPMQQLAARNPYFNILAPKVAGNLSTETYDSLFQTFKVIYPDYARSHFVSDLKTVVTDTILQRWSIHLQVTDFYMMIDTDQGAQMLDDLPHSLLDILNWYYPSWKTHQHLDAFTSRECSPLVLTPHPDPHDTGFAVQIQVIPRGHPFVTATRSTKTAAWSSRHTVINPEKPWKQERSWQYSCFPSKFPVIIFPTFYSQFPEVSPLLLPPHVILLKHSFVPLFLHFFGFRLLSNLYLFIPLSHGAPHGWWPTSDASNTRFDVLDQYHWTFFTIWWSNLGIVYSPCGQNGSDFYHGSHYFHQEDQLPFYFTTWWTLDLGEDRRWQRNLEAGGNIFGKHAPHAWQGDTTHHRQPMAPVLRHTRPLILPFYDHTISGSSTSWTFQRSRLTTIWRHTGSTTYSPVLLGALCWTSLTRYNYIFILATMEIYTTILTIGNTPPNSSPNTPTKPLHHPHRPVPPDEPGPMDMSDSSV